MSACIPGREVDIELRVKGTTKIRWASVVCPAKWKRSQLLRYVRAEHPGESVRIVKWHPYNEVGGGIYPRLWIVSPEEMARV